VSLTNSSQVELEIHDITIEGDDAANFTLSSSGNFNLAPVAFESFQVSFTPDSTREYTATLVIASDEKDSPKRINILGEGGTPSSAGDVPAVGTIRLGQSHPNPVSRSAHGFVEIEVSSGNSSADYDLIVFDMLGREMLRIPVALRPGAGIVNIQLPIGSNTELTPGTYYYTLRGSSQTRLPIRTMIVTP
jgi:Cep192 domain 4